MLGNNLLQVSNLKTSFKTEEGKLHAVDGITFSVERGKTLGIVGESGCGKSVTSLSILRLIQEPGKIESGDIQFEDKNLLSLSDEKMRKIRGKEIAMIFQEPMTALNPVFTCGYQISETLKLHFPNLSTEAARAKAIDLLRKVGIPAPEKRFDEYPHQLSGGMRQRVMIAMAISCEPKLLIADEPTTALDVTIQAQILDLLRGLQKESQLGMILITHDLGVVAEMCEHVAIMYAGKIVEYGTVEDIFYRPRHPYTRGLLDSIPHFETGKKLDTLKTIPGMVPNLLHLPKGCRFQDRCAYKQKDCEAAEPVLRSEQPGQLQQFACYHPMQVKA